MDSSAVRIECSDQPLDFSFHPNKTTLLAAALVDGSLEVHDFQDLLEHEKAITLNTECDDDDIDTIISSTNVHTQLLPDKSSESGARHASCRSVLFGLDGCSLYTGGSAGDLAKLDTEVVCTFQPNQSRNPVLWRIPEASYNKSPIHTMHEISAPGSPTHGLIVTGDDVGGVRIWDPRIMGTAPPQPGRKPMGCVFSWKEHDDYISDFDNSPDGMTLLASSADCTLSIYDLSMAQQSKQQNVEKEKIVRRSDDQEDELLSVKVIKHGKKVVCGTAEGILDVWSWGTWGDISDRFPGHPQSVDALLKFDEDVLLTGSSDGLIRVVSIHPDKLLGVLGDHGGFPIEKLAFTADRQHVASLTHDVFIRLWDCHILHENADGASMNCESSLPVSLETGAKTGRESDEEWDDMDEDGSDGMEDEEDSDSDDDDADKGKAGKLSRRFKSENEKFFEDL